ncbi:MAG: hypothetical protein WD400_01840, partial [Pontimonas sp.]
STIQEAETEARRIVEAASQEASATVAEAEKRLAALRVEKDTIASYVESLRSVVDVVDSADQDAQSRFQKKKV